ncbi:MAG TPA: helix-turn-helix transcriptional regulator [Dermatophilaceae bacterium]|nr:helix-turn-helix transcriptional regulator [Dermatophilaceae bacterium]
MAEDPDGSFDVSVPTRDITALNSAFASGGYASTEIEEIIGRSYLHLIRQPLPHRDHLREVGCDEPTTDAVLSVLRRRRFLQVAPDGAITLTPPDLALREHALRLERHAADVLSTTGEITRIYANARTQHGHGSTEGIRVLYSVADVAMAAADVVAGSDVEILTMRAPTLRLLELAAVSPEAQDSLSRNARGVRVPMRTIYDIRLLQIPNALDLVGSRRGSEEQRSLTNLPFSATIGDTTAVIDLSFPGRTGPMGLFFAAPELAAVVRDLAQRLWEMSSPVSKSAGASELDDRERRVLALLVAGLSDAAIARQVGVSQRTIERRVSALMERLGASSRFQAGVLARDRGWI